MGACAARKNQRADVVPLGRVVGERPAGVVKNIRGMGSNDQNLDGA